MSWFNWRIRDGRLVLDGEVKVRVGVWVEVGEIGRSLLEIGDDVSGESS